MFDPRTHEAAERIFWCMDNRFAAHVERSVHHKWAAGAFLKGGDQRVILRVRIFVNRLNTGRIVDMRDCWNV